MKTNLIDEKTLKNMLLGGIKNLAESESVINDLNVFPVPDGDTGTNMIKTLEGGLAQLSSASCEGVGELMEGYARGLLLGARGNSGVILSQIFAGIKDGLSALVTADAVQLATAYEMGVKKSYSAVANPTEGTILTVFRESAEYALKNVNEQSSIEDFYRLHIEEAARSLERTQEILPVLKEAGVVDSGGAGYLKIAEGMYRALTGEIDTPTYDIKKDGNKAELDFDRFTSDTPMERGYCTEFLLRLTRVKCSPEDFEVGTLVSALEEIGDSIVAYKEGDIVKIHVHTKEPNTALGEALKYGEFLTVKIENMELGHSDTERVKDKPNRKFSVLTVAKGEGLSSLFLDMGADCIISGGQTDNPSTEEFLRAFRDYHAEHILVLPNNKNVMLAATQAAEMYEDGRVHIIPTHTLMEGYGALSVITPGIQDVDALVESATRAAKSIVGAEITKAVREVTIGGKSITKGDYIAISGGKITAVAPDRDTALLMMLESVEDIDDYEIITLFVGEDVDDDARVDITDKIEDKYPDHEVVVYKGKQALYDYLVAIE